MERRLAACAQVSAAGEVTLKTTAARVRDTDAAVIAGAAAWPTAAGGVRWAPIVANEPYLKWLIEECA